MYDLLLGILHRTRKCHLVVMVAFLVLRMFTLCRNHGAKIVRKSVPDTNILRFFIRNLTWSKLNENQVHSKCSNRAYVQSNTWFFFTTVWVQRFKQKWIEKIKPSMIPLKIWTASSWIEPRTNLFMNLITLRVQNNWKTLVFNTSVRRVVTGTRTLTANIFFCKLDAHHKLHNWCTSFFL